MPVQELTVYTTAGHVTTYAAPEYAISLDHKRHVWSVSFGAFVTRVVGGFPVSDLIEVTVEYPGEAAIAVHHDLLTRSSEAWVDVVTPLQAWDSLNNLVLLGVFALLGLACADVPMEYPGSVEMGADAQALAINALGHDTECEFPTWVEVTPKELSRLCVNTACTETLQPGCVMACQIDGLSVRPAAFFAGLARPTGWTLAHLQAHEALHALAQCETGDSDSNHSWIDWDKLNTTGFGLRDLGAIE